ncbi:MAG: hypothetical protein MI923_06475 [Phycisphaerales bacterium]|nr:hypothetical protein [Phycisphaerales bacterium]
MSRDTKKKMSFVGRMSLVSVLLVGLIQPVWLGGCGLGDNLVDPINNIANQIDAAIAAIDINSDQWQQIVEDLRDDIPEIENDLKADLQEVIDRGVGTIGVTIFATNDFVARRIQEALDRVKAKFTGDPVPVYPPAFLSFSPDFVDVARVRDGEQLTIAAFGYDFDRLDPSGRGMELWLLRGGVYVDCSYAMTATTHYEATINLAANGVPMSLDCAALELRWGTEIISTLPILQPSPPQPDEETINFQNITFRPEKTRGDADFKGHGPFVFVESEIRMSDFDAKGAKKIQARVYMLAEETKSDWTTAEGWSSWKTVYNCPPGYRLVDVLTPMSCEESYVDTDHSEDQYCPGLGNLVECFRCIGDTDGDDAGRTTRVTVDFAPARVLMIEDDPYFD